MIFTKTHLRQKKFSMETLTDEFELVVLENCENFENRKINDVFRTLYCLSRSQPKELILDCSTYEPTHVITP